MGSDYARVAVCWRVTVFQSTLPVWGATAAAAESVYAHAISIHAPRVGSDGSDNGGGGGFFAFQSTLPVWGATAPGGHLPSPALFQSTLPVWGATPRGKPQRKKVNISIHAPRVGSDGQQPAHPHHHRNFNPRSPCGERRCAQSEQGRELQISIHAPRVGSDYPGPGHPAGRREFQSTLPVWGATVHQPTQPPEPVHFNPRSPCGERRPGSMSGWSSRRISIHAPRVGSDPGRLAQVERVTRFQSTLPVWGATVPEMSIVEAEKFQSTLPVWGATWRSGAGAAPGYFNPRSPCGERLQAIMSACVGTEFQSTLPVWGATAATDWGAKTF